MFDTHAIARSLTAAGIDPGHADALTDAIRQAAEHESNRETLATKTDLANLRADIFRAMLVQTGVTVGLLGLLLGFLRWLG